MITVMYRSRLRLSEALARKPEDVDVEAETITVLHGKGDRKRVVGLDPGSMAIVMRWADKRHQMGHTGHSPMFSTLEGRPIGRQVISDTRGDQRSREERHGERFGRSRSCRVGSFVLAVDGRREGNNDATSSIGCVDRDGSSDCCLWQQHAGSGTCCGEPRGDFSESRGDYGEAIIVG